jgi:hypothetical protein
MTPGTLPSVDISECGAASPERCLAACERTESRAKCQLADELRLQRELALAVRRRVQASENRDPNQERPSGSRRATQDTLPIPRDFDA